MDVDTRRKAAGARVAGILITGASETNLDPEATLPTPPDDDMAAMAVLGLREVQKMAGTSTHAVTGPSTQPADFGRVDKGKRPAERILMESSPSRTYRMGSLTQDGTTGKTNSSDSTREAPQEDPQAVSPADPPKLPTTQQQVDPPGSENITRTMAKLMDTMAELKDTMVSMDMAEVMNVMASMEMAKVKNIMASMEMAKVKNIMASLTMEAQNVKAPALIPGEILHLNCLQHGRSTKSIFRIVIRNNESVAGLQSLIKDARINFKDTNADELILWKVSISRDKLDEAHNQLLKNEESLEPLQILSDIFPNIPDQSHLHIIIMPPPMMDTPVRTKTLDSNEGQVLLKTLEVGVGVWDCGTRTEAIASFLESLCPKIKEFLSHPRDTVWMPPDTVDAGIRQFYYKLAIPSVNDKPNLLLHNLGNKTNPNGDTLFQNGAYHRILCNTSGAGKTALLFNGLCSRWGFYFVAAQDTNRIGAKDLELAIDIMSHSQGWIQDAFTNSPWDNIQSATKGNETIAFKWIYKVLLARWYLFDTFIKVAKEQYSGNLPHNVKRDWLLFQIRSVILVNGVHPFLAFINSCLVGMSTVDLQSSFAKFTPEDVLGSAFNNQRDIFFCILDEAQVAGERHINAFADANGEIRRPILRPIIRAWNSVSAESIRFIVSGTGFWLSLFQTVLTSGVSKDTPQWTVVHKTGDFIDETLQKSYITRYLPPHFLSSPSGIALVSRMFEWLRGRYRFTASFIEQLLAGAWTSKGPSSPHKLLNAYVHVLTNFTPIDCASALLVNEPDVDSPKLEGFPWDKLKKKLEQDKELLKELSSSLYTYITRGQYPIWYKDRQFLVEYGVARFMGQKEAVVIKEPLALVGILRYFDAEGLTIDADIRTQMQSNKGVAFEEAVLLSCTRIFQVGAHLSDVFFFHGGVPDWARQKGWIVSRQGQESVVEGIVDGNLDFKLPEPGVACFAEDPDDVTNWITSKSNVWCIPGPLMGPDLMAWLRLEDGKLILLLIHVPNVTAGAIQSLTPCHLYSSLHSKSAQAKKLKMLEAINTPDECFTGARYNILRVVAPYPLDAWIDPRRSQEIAGALQEDQHPLATFKHAPLISSLATRDNTPTILISLANSLKRDREDKVEDEDKDYPKRKSRKKSRKSRKKRKKT